MKAFSARGVMPRLMSASLLIGSAPLLAQDVPKTQQVQTGANRAVLPLKHEPRPTSSAITTQDLMTRLYIYADDSLGGRDVGTEGHFKATEYLAAEAKRMGLKPAGENGTYFQTLPLKSRRVDRLSSFVSGGTNVPLGSGWAFSGMESITTNDAEVVFAGPLSTASATAISADQARGRVVAYTITSNENFAQAREGRVERPAGSAGLLFILPPQARGFLGFFLQSGLAVVDDSVPSDGRLWVSDSTALLMFGKSARLLTEGDVGAKLNVKAVVSVTAPAFPARNVVALLEGSDPKLKNQYVAVGAHSDHVGTTPRGMDHDSILVFNRIVRPGGAEDSDKFGTPEQFAEINAELAERRKTQPTRRDSIFNGADDDGSGTVAVQEIAEYLSSLKTKPKRSTLFVWHAGEEKGLWGSAFYTEHPTVPRDSIVAQLNVDMVGRGSTTDVTGAGPDGKPLHGGPDYLQLVGSRRLSTELGDLVERVNKDKKHNFSFDYAMDANGHPMNIYCRSDHYEYAKWGIPVTFFTTGGHSAYHQLTDEPQYIDYPHMQRVTRLIADITLEVGNRATRPTVDGVKLDPRGSCKQ
ncbi:MAG: M28 family peptidase [Gemmatimonadaceae bacterium]|nr:M28 family peptidase [Gemmatimonadaceae bacterium]